jgi:hypothetical protein
MKISEVVRALLLAERGLCVSEACDKCGRLLGAVRFARGGESGVWCSRECRGGIQAKRVGICQGCEAPLAGMRRGSKFCSSLCRVRENRKSQTGQNSRNEQLKAKDLKTGCELLAIPAPSAVSGASQDDASLNA